MKPVPLIRWFNEIAPSYEEHDLGLAELWDLVGRGRQRHGWPELCDERRVVILADAGAGKTYELKAQAERLVAKGKAAFFIRIEDIDASFGSAFEVGSAEAFEDWLAGTGDAWFFLDSVDEVRLEEARAFENAIQAFAARIRQARQRAHVYISSRPYAWRSKLDRQLIEELLPYEPERGEATGERDGEARGSEPVDETAPGKGLSLYRLAPLDVDDIRMFAAHRGVSDIEGFIDALERRALFDLAKLPFDLEDIVAIWKETGSLESRLDVLERGIERRLASAGPAKPTLSLERALDGARRLALATILTNEANIRMPSSTEAGGIDAAAWLDGWSGEDVTALLSRGVFSDAIFGMVRFRHREIRDLLTARWFAERLDRPGLRGELEGLIFREQYGEAVIVPRFRSVLPWLILFDASVRARALAISPEIATEGGDAARLPIAVRKAILSEIVRLIVEKEGRGGDNSAIARIAQADLEGEALALIDRYADHDDAIFFLGRLVWQGHMVRAAERLVAIASDASRGIYARIASTRAVVTILGDEGRTALWTTLAQEADLPRRLLAELLDGAAPNEKNVDLLLASLETLEKHDRYEVTGLGEAIDLFIRSLPLTGARAVERPLPRLVSGLAGLLGREPYVERRECRVSKTFRWLMAPAMQAVERLIVGRLDESFGDAALRILSQVPALRDYIGHGEGDQRTRLHELIPRWIELNDTLFWRTVEDARAALAEEGKTLEDDWPVEWLGHFWRFDAASFGRTAEWIVSRPLSADRAVALSRSFRTYAQNGRPRPWLSRLKKSVGADTELARRLYTMLHPLPSAHSAEWRADRRKYAQQRRRRELAEAKHRAAFVAHLRANPDFVRVPPGLKPGEVSHNQANLLMLIEGDGLRMTRSDGADWKSLIPEFGDTVAEAFRDGAMRHWRLYTPTLRSEGHSGNEIPYALIFAMAGLDIEAGDDGRGLAGLGREEAQHAMRYALWEMNGFPRWLEPLYRAYPDLGLARFWTEARWELENAPADEHFHYVLHDLIYHAPWLHSELARPIYDWLTSNDTANDDSLRYSRHIMAGGGVSAADLARLAETKTLSDHTPSGQVAGWFALWVDTDPGQAIPALETRLDAMEAKEAIAFAQQFIVSLLGGRDHGGTPGNAAFKAPEHLKSLYILMHRYVRVRDDIDRHGKGVYTPTLRDEAQDGRNQLFSLLSDIPGEASYRALRALATEHPVSDYRLWMEKRAYSRAVEDSDNGPWSIEAAQALQRRIEARSIAPADNDIASEDLLAEAENAIDSKRSRLRGEPVFKGTRIPVRMIVGILDDGASDEEILSGYPALTPRLLRLARVWVAAHPRSGKRKTLEDRGATPTSQKRVPSDSAARRGKD